MASKNFLSQRNILLDLVLIMSKSPISSFPLVNHIPCLKTLTGVLFSCFLTLFSANGMFYIVGLNLFRAKLKILDYIKQNFEISFTGQQPSQPLLWLRPWLKSILSFILRSCLFWEVEDENYKKPCSRLASSPYRGAFETFSKIYLGRPYLCCLVSCPTH